MIAVKVYFEPEQILEIERYVAYRWSGSLSTFIRESVKKEMTRHPLKCAKKGLLGDFD